MAKSYVAEILSSTLRKRKLCTRATLPWRSCSSRLRDRLPLEKEEVLVLHHCQLPHRQLSSLRLGRSWRRWNASERMQNFCRMSESRLGSERGMLPPTASLCRPLSLLDVDMLPQHDSCRPIAASSPSATAGPSQHARDGFFGIWCRDPKSSKIESVELVPCSNAAAGLLTARCLKITVWKSLVYVR
jgi:hypothetical protein